MELTERICSHLYLDGLEQYHVEQESLLGRCCEQGPLCRIQLE